jgi:uncharacterized protein (DUF427 family)
MKTPGPDHQITLEPAATRWRARFAGHVIADSPNAIVLREADYPARIYFPRPDVAMEYMSRTERSTRCPYKGDATYYTILMDGRFGDNAVWSYEAPYPAMDAITGYLSFYPEMVEVYSVDEADVNPDARRGPEPRTVDVDQIVQHTDAGDGASQKEHWAANVETPGVTDDGGLR